MTDALRSCLILCSVLASALTAHAAESRWVKAPSRELLAQTPGLVHETFESVWMQTEVGYSVVLPPGYEATERRFPVVYWLHGGGGNECSSVFTANVWRDLYAKQQVGEVILVYPNGFRSGYMDHHNGKVMIESMIIRELIPRIDRRFRTIATRAGRAAHGFSMGASGALKFAIKHPDLFCSAVAYGGGAIDLARSRSQFILEILERNLKSDPALIRRNNTYHFLEANQAVLRTKRLEVLLICGEADSWKASAVTFQDALREKMISCELELVPGVGHDLRGLIEAEGATAARFQDRVFRAGISRALQAGNDTATTISESYYSEAEGRREYFEAVLPPGFRPESEYPLLVQILGGRNLLPTQERPFIRVRLNGRGVWGFRSMSRYDVLQVIGRMKEAYYVDEDRVYITGTSSGATGMMHAAAQRPDVFAGALPLIAFGNDLPLENFGNLPIRCEHGVDDWTSAIGNVRVQFQKLQKLGYDATLIEHPTAGHGIRVPPPAAMDWLFGLKRNSSPKTIVYSCEHPRDGRAYWLKIEKFSDPHAIARVDAQVESAAVNVATENVREIALDLSTAPLDEGLQLRIDGNKIEFERPAERGWIALARDGKWKAVPPNRNSAPERAYAAGAAANLFQGEPLLIVYGTGANDGQNQFLQQAANDLASSGGPTFQPASVRFPVRADNDVSDLALESSNLLLVGTPQNNSVLARLASKLPYRIEKGVLFAGDRAPLALTGSVLGIHYFNPEHPNRIIYVLSPYLNESEQQRFLQNPREFLAGSDGFKMIDQPDLLVRGHDLRIRREMQFDDDWEFISYAGTDFRIADRYADRMHLAMAHMKAMHRAAAVDLALWWGPEDKGLFGGYDFNWLTAFDPESYTLADFSVRHRETESMTAVVPGTELRDIFVRWISTKELITWPELTKGAIESDRDYSIVIPMDLVPKLGIRQKTLSNVAVGPSILPDQIAAEIWGATD